MAGMASGVGAQAAAGAQAGVQPHKTVDLGHLHALERQLRAALIGRDTEVRGLLVAALSKQNVLLLGPPGTAKSMLTRLLAKAFGGPYFELLFSRFTQPEEVFGPLSIKRMIDEEVYVRNTSRYLPAARLAFADEALALTTPLLTTKGWKTVGTVQVGDYVYGLDGQPTEVLGLTEVATDHPCYEVTFRDGHRMVTDGGHKWWCRPTPNLKDTPWRVLSTAEMARDKYTPSGKKRNYQLPLPQAALRFAGPGQEAVPDPYTLGLWLGNGNCWNGELYIRNEEVPQVLSRVQEVYPEARKAGSHGGNLTVISMAGTGFRGQLATRGLLGEDASNFTGSHKAIPVEYLTLPSEQRLSLLQGLMDTDGSCTKGNTCIFSNTNENVVDGVVVIVRSLGAVATKVAQKDVRVGKNGPHKQCWKVTFNGTSIRDGEGEQANPFHGRDAGTGVGVWERFQLITDVCEVSSVPVRCLTVAAKDHLFLAGENLVATHNCFKANSAILNALLTIINEREYDNGGERVKVPLEFLVGASNELPQDGALAALYDRFLLRYWVDPVPEDQADRLLTMDEPTITMRVANLTELQEATTRVELPAVVRRTMIDIRTALKTAATPVLLGDRRFRASRRLVQANALLNKRLVATPTDCAILAYSYWETPADRTAVAAAVGNAIRLSSRP